MISAPEAAVSVLYSGVCCEGSLSPIMCLLALPMLTGSIKKFYCTARIDQEGGIKDSMLGYFMFLIFEGPHLAVFWVYSFCAQGLLLTESGDHSGC